MDKDHRRNKFCYYHVALLRLQLQVSPMIATRQDKEDSQLADFLTRKKIFKTVRKQVHRELELIEQQQQIEQSARRTLLPLLIFLAIAVVGAL